MNKRLHVALVLISSVLLLCSTALAANDQRRVTLKDGTTVTGQILERGETHLVIKREDGVAQELNRADIELIEVLLGTDQTEPELAAESHWTGEAMDADTEVLQIADSLADFSPAQLHSKYRRAIQAHGLAVAPTLPMMISGTVFSLMVPLIASDGDSVLGLGGLSVALTSGSTVTAALGAQLGRKAVGNQRSLRPFHLGMSFAIAGNLSMNLGSALLTATLEGNLYSDLLYYGAPVITLTGLGFYIAGQIILMADALLSREGISTQLKRQRRRNYHSAVRPLRPAFAGAWAAPLPGGAAGGFSLRF
ncbi:MAG: hypothetical protein CMP23_07975 [Rickettsiales bacterium]|nr:hypothetical protein [Rickettsiales bacterium]|tara:strand:- start:1250 stop:2170 length:921 start_codon:yes stop_codon:yes gene_type:complete